jgi:hypothetical protein
LIKPGPLPDTIRPSLRQFMNMTQKVPDERPSAMQVLASRLLNRSAFVWDNPRSTCEARRARADRSRGHAGCAGGGRHPRQSAILCKWCGSPCLVLDLIMHSSHTGHLKPLKMGSPQIQVVPRARCHIVLANPCLCPDMHQGSRRLAKSQRFYLRRALTSSVTVALICQSPMTISRCGAPGRGRGKRYPRNISQIWCVT